MKIGGEYNYNPYVSEDALNLADTGGTYQFAADQPFDPNNPASIAGLTRAIRYTASSNATTLEHPTHYYVMFVQDDWRVARNVTLNLGLRYERLYGPANEDLDLNDFPRPLPFVDVSERGDKNNLGPRLGVAWDLRGNGATVVRSAYGMYYGHIRLLGTLPEFANFKTFSIVIDNPAYPDPFDGRDPSDFITSQAAPNITVVSNDMVQPLAHQASAGISHRLSDVFALHVDAVYNNTKGDYKTLDLNARPSPTAPRPDPTYARIDQMQAGRGSSLHSALRKTPEALQPELPVHAVRTRSPTLTTTRPWRRYLDPFNFDINWGPSNGERRHAIGASGFVLLPWDINVGALWSYRSSCPGAPAPAWISTATGSRRTWCQARRETPVAAILTSTR